MQSVNFPLKNNNNKAGICTKININTYNGTEVELQISQTDNFF